jgi:hypothetical protein
MDISFFGQMLTEKNELNTLTNFRILCDFLWSNPDKPATMQTTLVYRCGRKMIQLFDLYFY